jgi:hypothetical protein
MSSPQWPSAPNQPAASDSALAAPSERISESARSVLGPVLPILFTVLWLIVGAVSTFLLFFSVFLFDSGGSTWTWVIFYGFLVTVLLCPTSIIAGWIAWGLTRKDRSRGFRRVVRIIVYSLPVLGILMVILGFVAIEALCGGSLSCN